MNDLNLLLRAIIENPNDDTPRLAYADCLEENGDADRAEFIRVQCAIAKHPKRWVISEGVVVSAYGPNYWTITGGERLDHGSLFVNEVKVGDRVDLLQPRDYKRDRKPMFGLRLSKYVDGDAVLVKDELSGPDPVAKERVRQKELWEEHIVKFTHFPDKANELLEGEPFGSRGPDVVVSRGFISMVNCTSEDFLKYADQLVWHPKQTVECKGCRGTGDETSDGQGTCGDCKGKSKLPRPCPDTAHPIRKVRLTTDPRDVDGWDGKFKQVLRVETGLTVWRCDDFPGIEFKLPPVEGVLSEAIGRARGGPAPVPRVGYA